MNWNRVDLLEIVELYAEENGGIASEQELSERFDSEVLPSVIAEYGEDDNRPSTSRSTTGRTHSARTARFNAGAIQVLLLCRATGVN
jgi:hypothetical protein